MVQINTPLLSCHDLSFSYLNQPVLQVSGLQFNAGECVGLIGANGAGKSTLIQLLLGLLTPTAGKVRLRGTPLALCNRRQIARQLSYVPQDSSIQTGLTVREVVAMGRYPHQHGWLGVDPADQTVIDQALSQTDLSTMAGRSLQTLSGGERQRVFIARALAQQAEVLLLDEPTASLDLNHQLEVMQQLSEFVAASGTVLVALHDLTLAARYCDRLILLDQGRVVADGAPVEVLTEANLRQCFHVRAQVSHEAGSGKLQIQVLEALSAAEIQS